MFSPPRPKLDQVIADAESPLTLFKKETARLRLSHAFQLATAPEAKLNSYSHVVVPGDVESQFKSASLFGNRHALFQMLHLAHPALRKIQLAPKAVFGGRERIITSCIAFARRQRLVVRHLQALAQHKLIAVGLQPGAVKMAFAEKVRAHP